MQMSHSKNTTGINLDFLGFMDEVAENSRFLSEQEAYAYMDAMIYAKRDNEDTRHYIPYWKHHRLYIATKLMASVDDISPCIFYRGHTFIQQPKSNVL